MSTSVCFRQFVFFLHREGLSPTGPNTVSLYSFSMSRTLLVSHFHHLHHVLCLYALFKKKKKSFSQGMWLSLFVVLSTRFLFSSLNTIIWLCLIAIHLNTRTNYPPLSGNSAHPRMKTASRQGDHFFYIFARSRTSTCALFTPKLESLESDLLVQK